MSKRHSKTAYLTEDQYDHWVALADELGLKFGEFAIEMIEEGIESRFKEVQ